MTIFSCPLHVISARLYEVLKSNSRGARIRGITVGLLKISANSIQIIAHGPLIIEIIFITFEGFKSNNNKNFDEGGSMSDELCWICRIFQKV